jgi:signal transduction histidine kinase
MHGGRIWLTSKPNIGTTVFFDLPKRQAATAGIGHAA